MPALFIDDQLVADQLSIPEATCSVSAAFRALSAGEARNEVRTRTSMGDAVLNVMRAVAPPVDALGVKSYVTVGRGITRGAGLDLLLYSFRTGKLTAHVQANRLGQLRTGAATVVATQALAMRQPVVLAVFGTGFQAEFQIRCLLTALPSLAEVRIAGRTAERATALAERLITEFGYIRFLPCSVQDAATAADVIVTATASATPLFEACWLKPGVHINAIGSNDARKCEIGRDVLERASRIFVDDLQVAETECGDLLVNGWDVSATRPLGDLLLGKTAGRVADGDITLFESQGLALQDVFCAAMVLAKATERGLGSALQD